HLSKLPLVGINLNTTGVGDGALEVFGKILTLRSIQMDSTNISDSGMMNLKDLPALQRLRIHYCDITDGYSALKGKTSLQRLELRDTSIRDEQLKMLCQLPEITYLNLSECRLISAEGLASVGDLKKLTYLGLWETKTNDDSFAAYKGLTSLQTLNLEATGITDESVPLLLTFTQLTDLNLAGTQLTDQGFSQLNQLKNLKKLNVANTRIGFDIIDELFEALPDCDIIE
ncbi:MAG: adenylate cyclase, partial [Planctomycetota bacterium]